MGEKEHLNGDPPFERYFEKEQEGQIEYSYWGWLRWDVLETEGDWHLISRLSQFEKESIQNADKPGDRLLANWKGKGFFHFCTSTQGYKSGDENNVCQNMDYDD